MPIMTSLFLLLLAGGVQHAVATGHEAKPPEAPEERSAFICNEVLGGEKGWISVRHDGLSHAYAEAGLKDALEVRDVLHMLGVPTPPHQIIFAPERQLNILASSGVLPMPHAISGAQIARAIGTGQGLGILEFAQPGGAPASYAGCATCRSYYSNMTTLRDQRPIYFHVGGHNHVFQRSLLSVMRNSDPIAASEKLAEEIERQYRTRGEEEVSLFIHYLEAMKGLQDYVDGTFEPPANLAPAVSGAVEKDLHRAPGEWGFLNTGEKVKTYSWDKTPSVLQYMVANPASHLPEFKRTILEKFELTNRVYPAVVQQKTVHEAWATFMMMLGQKHSAWTSDRDVWDFARVVQGAAGKELKIDQPYTWVRGVYHLYQKFKRRPDMQGLSERAVDIKFVQEVDRMLPTLTDADFINRVVDDEFVNEHHLSLFRPGTEEELAPLHETMKEQGVPQDQWPNAVIISRSAERIRRAIIRRVGMKNMPLFEAINPAITNPFQITLEQRVIEGMPIEPLSAAQVFFAATQVTEVPVSATMLLSNHWLGINSFGTTPVRVEVRPDGRVRIFGRMTIDAVGPVVNGQTQPETELVELSKKMQEAVDFYKTDQSFSFSANILEEDRKRWEQMFPKMIDEEVAKANTPAVEGLVDYAPSAARAIMLYSKLLKARFAKQMEAAFQGKIRLKFGPNGVKLPLIPMTPHIQYDRTFIQQAAGQIPPAPMDTIEQRLKPTVNWRVDEDDNTGLAPVGGSVGDGLRVPGGGQGQSQKSKGSKSGEEGELPDPQDITIPSELYRRILGMHFEIPNPRLTDGETPMWRDIRMGQRRDDSEEPIWEEMTAAAMVKAIIARRAKGQPNSISEIPPVQLLREGMGLLDEDDYIVRSKREVELPSFDAVVVVAIDLSGSMGEHRLKLVRNAVYNIRELFRLHFPNVKFRFIGFDHEAKEYPESEIFNTNRGGASYYKPPLVKAAKIFKEYPHARWNQYLFFAGDSEIADLREFMKVFGDLQPQLQYMGLIVTRDQNDPVGIDTNGLRAALEAYKQSWKWIGITQLNDQSEILRGMGDLFPKSSGGQQK